MHAPLTSEQQQLVVQWRYLPGAIVRREYKIKRRDYRYRDILDAAHSGLIYAAHKFDRSYGNEFSTCAVAYVRKRINSALHAHTCRGRNITRQFTLAPDGRTRDKAVPCHRTRDPLDSLASADTAAVVSLVVDSLDPESQFIVRHRFGLGGAEFLTFDEIGERIGYRKSTVSNKWAEIEQRLRVACARALAA